MRQSYDGFFRKLVAGISQCAAQLFVTAAFVISLQQQVTAQQGLEGSAETKPAVQPGRDVTKLPAAVQRMRQAILQAAVSGDIGQLRVPVEMNELPPAFGKDRVKDPVAHFKTLSADGNGREILAVLIEILTTGYAVKDAGTNNEMVIWPYFAEAPLDKLTPGQEVEAYKLFSPAKLKEMREKGRYTYYRLGISADGVWHYFTADD